MEMDLLTVAGAAEALENAKKLRVATLIAMRTCSESEYRQLREMQGALDALITRLQCWLDEWSGRRAPVN